MYILISKQLFPAKFFLWGFLLLCGGCAISRNAPHNNAGKMLALANHQGKMGVIDSKGAWVMQPKFDYLELLNSKQVLARNKTSQWYLNACFLTDIKGNILHRFPDSLNVRLVNSGNLLAAQVISQQKFKKTGLVNWQGKWIILPRYDAISSFSEGLASVKLNNKWGVINEQGREVIPLVYEQINEFLHGRAIAKKGGLYGLIDPKGTPVIPHQYTAMGKSRLQGFMTVKTGGQWGVISEQNGWELKPQYEFVELLGADRALVMQLVSDDPKFKKLHYPRKLLVVSLPGGKIIKKLGSNSFVYAYHNGLAQILTETTLDWHGINTTIARDHCLPFRLCPTKQDFGARGFINTSGKVVIAPEYKQVSHFSGGVACKQIDKEIQTAQGIATTKRWIYMGTNGRQAIRGDFAQITPFIQGLAAVKVWVPTKQQYLWGFIDRTGKWSIKPQFEEVSGFRWVD